jgi:predicted permease
VVGQIVQRLPDGDLADRETVCQPLGVPLFRGRAFTSAEERPGIAPPVVILSYPYWKKMGGGEVLGQPLRIDGRRFTIVGIAREGFSGTMALVSPELYLPLGMHEAVVNDFEGRARPMSARDNHVLFLVGRLRPGVAREVAGRQLAVLADNLAKAYPAENKDQTVIVRKLSRLSVSDSPQDDSPLLLMATLLLAASGVVLLIASLNVANMMLARGSSRRKEIAIRLALGGGRKKIVRQLFTEGLVLALLGGAGALVTAYWGTGLLVRSMGRAMPFDLVYSAGPDLRVLAATMTFCLLSTLLFSLMPALSLSRPNLVAGLKSSEREESDGRYRRVCSRRNVLVIGQIALSMVLLTAAGLFVQSSMKAIGVDPGFRVDRHILLEVDTSLAGYDQTHGRQTYPALVARLKSIPGVTEASLAATAPFGMIRLGRTLHAAGASRDLSAEFNIVGERYFQTLEIPILRGRSFLPRETRGGPGAGVAVLDQLAAKRLWPGEEAVGRHLQISLGDAANQLGDVEVIGVAASIRDRFLSDPSPHVYVPFGQEYQAEMNIHLQIAALGRDGETRLMETIQREVRAQDPGLPVLALRTFRDHLEASVDYWVVRTGARLFGTFGAVALLLATIGLYGVRAYSVAMRTREIGIRMALGANPGEALRLVLREGLLLTAIGLSIGLPLSFGISKLLSAFLYGARGANAAVMGAVAGLLALVAALACYLPARRAAGVQPIEALRYE